ncbi:hypothetical protein AB4Y36_38260 [Paraburkholderia sp. BR10936]|uniref:hypothetical protein n=1 Tax=Paraburkholderia sp. BR10936 TaxID=3236993 RepID=UPI0034D254B6
MTEDLWERCARIVCVSDLAQAAGIAEPLFAIELRRRYPTEAALRAMWARVTQTMPLMRDALDD